MEASQFTTLYFGWEKLSSLFFIAIGLIGIITTLFDWQKTGQAIFRWTPYPLALFGSVSLIVGCTIFFRTDSQVSGLLSLVQSDPGAYFQQELERMARVNKNWAIYKWSWLFIISVSLIVIMVFLRKPALLGLALATIMITVPMFTLDIIGERNGLWYVEQIKSYRVSLSTS